MADEKADKNVEEEAQQESMPDSEQKATEQTDSSVAQETEEALGTSADDSGELPEGVSERTAEQFERLRGELREARQKAQTYESMLGRKQEPEEEVEPLYDQKTGYVNVQALEKLQKQALDADKRAKRAEEQITKANQDAQVRELYNAHPELAKPSTKEAKELYDDAERIWLHSQAYPEKYDGMALSQKQAADLAKKRMGNKPETPKQEAERLEPKEQASLEASGRPTQGVQAKVASEEDQQRLAVGTRLGDRQSMIERMRAIRESQKS